MAAPQTAKPSRPRRTTTHTRRSPGLYRLEADAEMLAALQLPSGTAVFIKPATKAAEAELSRTGAVVKPKTATTLWRRTSVSAPKPERDPVVSAKAFEPDARARAILRGVAYAQQDLEEAGGAYDVDDVRTLLRGVSRQALDKKVADGSLLAIPGPSGRRRFPTVQFNDDGSVVAGLKDVQSALGYESRWAVLNFLINQHDLLDSERPIDVLRRGEVERAVQAAKFSGAQGA